MNASTLGAIGDFVEPVSSWAPEWDDPDGVFTYIDLSAVDQDAKVVASARELPCSEAPSRARQLVHAGDVLVSTVRPNLNGVALVPAELQGATASTGFCVLRPKGGQLDSRYLFQWVKSPRFVSDMVRKATGANYPAVSDRIVCESKLPLLSLPEQRRIAAILDKADALRVQRRAALAQLDTLTQSIFLDMFGDPATNPKGWPIGQIGDFLESATYGTSEKSEAAGAYPVLRMNNITRNGEIDLSNLKYMELDEKELDRYLVRNGDVLFNRTNSPELVGKSAIFRESKPMAYAGYLIRLRANRQTNPEYLAGFLNTGYSKRVLRGMCKSIIGMANINAKEVQGITIPRPPLPLQHKFAHCVAGMVKFRSMHRDALADLDVLFSSLQHCAFRGEL